MVTSTGRQALLLSNRCRKAAGNGLSERPRQADTLPAGVVAGKNPSDSAFSSDGGEDINKSLSLLLTPTNSFPFSGELPRRSVESSQGGSLRRPPVPVLRLRNIRSVLRRRRWMTGLAVGLRVGLPATAHWVAKNLNFWRAAIVDLKKTAPTKFNQRDLNFLWGVFGFFAI